MKIQRPIFGIWILTGAEAIDFGKYISLRRMKQANRSSTCERVIAVKYAFKSIVELCVKIDRDYPANKIKYKVYEIIVWADPSKICIQ